MFSFQIRGYDYIFQEHIVHDMEKLYKDEDLNKGFQDAFAWIEENLKISADGYYKEDPIWGRFIWYNVYDTHDGFENVRVEAKKVDA